MAEEKKKGRILVVEDEKPYSRALVLKLDREGFEAKSAGDGEEASKIIRNEDFDLILLDLVMPKMNGFDFLEEMRKIGKNIPVMVLSNLAQEDDKRRALELGVSIFFEKANTPIAEVINKINSMLKD